MFFIAIFSMIQGEPVFLHFSMSWFVNESYRQTDRQTCNAGTLVMIMIMIMIINLYSANSMWHMFKCALQLACMRSNRKHWRRLWLPLYGSCMISKYGRGRITAPGRFPYSFREACEFFKVPRIGLVKVERLNPHPRTEGSSDRRWKALLTYGAGIRSPAGNRTRAALVRGQCANHSATWTPFCIEIGPHFVSKGATVAP